MGKKSKDLKNWIGVDMEGFRFIEYCEVFKVNKDGHRTKSLGYFRDEIVAKAFARQQVDSHNYKTEKAIIITDDEVGFLMGDMVTIRDDYKVAEEIRKKALEKLSPEERKILKIGE